MYCFCLSEAWLRPSRVRFVPSQSPDPCEEVSQLIAMRLLEKESNSGDMAPEKDDNVAVVDGLCVPILHHLPEHLCFCESLT